MFCSTQASLWLNTAAESSQVQEDGRQAGPETIYKQLP